jgi:hypothetical protein
MLINSAFPALYMSGVGYLSTPPDSNQGFGHINLENTLPLNTITSGLDLFVQEANLTEGMTLSIFTSVTSTSLPLRVTIVWTDAPGVVGTSKQLKHDVDLRVIDPSNTVYYGNGLATSDNLNPVERVVIYSPQLQVGEYQVVLSVAQGALVGASHQVVSIVITSYGSVIPDKTRSPTVLPTAVPTLPTMSPTLKPSSPSKTPTALPTVIPTASRAPTAGLFVDAACYLYILPRFSFLFNEPSCIRCTLQLQGE